MKTARVRNYSALEVANLCGVVNQTAINWIKKKYLQAHMTPGGQYRVYAEDLADFMMARGMKIPEELRSSVHGGSRSVLFIDDDDKFAWQFLEELKAEYPQCLADRACDGFEAGSKLAAGDKDLVLINGDMQELSARKVCEAIRKNPGGKEKSIIVFTDTMDNRTRETILSAGADVYIGKPFDIGHISIYLES